MTAQLRYALDNAKKAVQRLREAAEVQVDMNQSVILDGTIHRFELAYETTWKLMKLYMEKKGMQIEDSPRSLFREAVRIGIIRKGEEWLSMMSDRNAASHAYDEEMAKGLLNRIQAQHLGTFEGLLQQLEADV